MRPASDCPADIPSLVETARETLRKGFLTARVGLSGANAALADSGTICIVTNEGNGRLVTTLPETHIALIGMEKIVPTLNEALDILAILPKNATGQKITSYVSLIDGPSPARTCISYFWTTADGNWRATRASAKR